MNLEVLNILTQEFMRRKITLWFCGQMLNFSSEKANTYIRSCTVNVVKFLT